MANNLDPQVLAKAQAWLDGNYDEATKVLHCRWHSLWSRHLSRSI